VTVLICLLRDTLLILMIILIKKLLTLSMLAVLYHGSSVYQAQFDFILMQ